MDISSNKQAKSHTWNLRHKITRNWEEKQLCGYFKLQTSEISYEKTWTWLRRNWIYFNSSSKQRHKDQLYCKVKMDKTQLNIKYRLCSDRDETINHIQKISTKRIQELIGLGGVGDALGIVPESVIWPYCQMFYAKTRIRTEERNGQNSLRF